MDLLEKLNNAREARVEATKAYRDVCKEFIEKYKERPENMRSVEYFFHKHNAKQVHKNLEPWQIDHLFIEDVELVRKPEFAECGQYVAINPLKSRKTYLGVLIGELAGPAVTYDRETKALSLTSGYGTTAIWVPELNKVVMGYESQSEKIKNPEEITKFVSAEGTFWYEHALKQLKEKQLKNQNDRWMQEPPTEQGWYWHWAGDDDSSPLPVSVLWSGSSNKCFVSAGQLGLDTAVMCDEYGGFWQKMIEPPIN